MSWFGGEPLYGWAAVEELAPYFVEKVDEGGVRFASNMTTNGYLLAPYVVDRLFAFRINSFQITLDGAGEDHDSHRPTGDGQGTFSTIFGNLVGMSRRKDDFRVNLRLNYDEENHGRAGELFDQVKSGLGGDSRFQFSFHAIGRWGGPNDESLAVCGDDREEIAARQRAAARERGLRVATLRDVSGAGIALARIAALQLDDTGEARREIAGALEIVRSYSEPETFEEEAEDDLCCGHMGRVEVLISAGRILGDEGLLGAAGAIARRVHDRARREGRHRTSASRGTDAFSPALFQGEAGIGYTYLRLASPDIVPGLLLFG